MESENKNITPTNKDLNVQNVVDLMIYLVRISQLQFA